MFDVVNKPKHYNSHPSGLECWEVIEHLPAEVANVIKYLWRSDLKNGQEDIEKAVWYLKRWDNMTYFILHDSTYWRNVEKIDRFKSWAASVSESATEPLLSAICLVDCAIRGIVPPDLFGKYVTELREELENL